mmetsp:Transcript_5394/g.22289  ORF Transcript_5394/g.22289 Transcript_5394/m.22289 type:complete len:665 (-) Transcript_5394:2155-4149(-)
MPTSDAELDSEFTSAARQFWCILGHTRSECTSNDDKLATLHVAVACAYDRFQALSAHAGKDQETRLKAHFAAHILSGRMREFAGYIEALIRCTFDEIALHGSKCVRNASVVLSESLSDSCQPTYTLWRRLHSLNWHSFIGNTADVVARESIRHCVSQMCHDCHESPVYPKIDLWRQGPLNHCMHILESGCTDVTCEVLPKQAMICIVDEIFLDLRLNELYDIIADFPDSICAVVELRTVLARTQQYVRFADRMHSVLHQRLLHPGANTSQIIDVYVSAVKLIRALKLGGNWLELVAQPIRSYLQKRKDTVRCIMSSLVDKASPGIDIESQQGGLPGFSTSHCDQASSASAILPALMCVYGSKDIFVREFKSSLASRLVCNSSDLDQELANLELLKLRFGDASLHDCEVMLRDLADSQRFNNRNMKNLSVDAVVISSVFWPHFPKDSMKLHPQLTSILTLYARRFNQLKNPQRLEWKPNLGTVHLRLTFEDGNSETFTVSPLHAVLLLHFESDNILSAQELAKRCGVVEARIRGNMTRWINCNVIAEVESGIYAVVNAGGFSPTRFSPTQLTLPPALGDSDNEELGLVADTSDVDEIYSSYVVGMLTNLGALPVERILNMLKLFAHQDGCAAPLTNKKLMEILHSLSQNQVVDFSQGHYLLSSRV